MAVHGPKQISVLLRRVLLCAVFVFLYQGLLSAADVTLEWDANTESDLKGYTVYYGHDSGQYDHKIFVGNVTAYTVPDLDVGVYFFAVTASDTSDLESWYSNEVFKVIPAQTFYYPRASIVSSFTGIDVPVFTGIAFANPDVNPAAFEITAFDSSGNQVDDPGLTNPVVRMLGPGQQLTAIDAQWFGSSSAIDSIAYAKVDSTTQISGLFEMFNSDLSILNGTDFASALTTSVFPTIAADGTRLQLVNANNSPQGVVFQLLDSQGGQLSSRWVLKHIAANAAIEIDPFSDLFPDASISGSEFIRVTAPLGVLPYAYLRGPGKSVQVFQGLDAAAGSTVLCAPEYAVGDNWWTTISVVNLHPDPDIVTFTFYPDGGGEPVSRLTYVDGFGKIEISDQSFFVSGDAASQKGYVSVTSNSVQLAGQVVFSDLNRQAFSAALPLVSSLSNSAFFSQAVSDETFYTGIAVVNPQDTPLNAVIRVYRSDGSSAATSNVLTIPARQRSVGMLADYFPDLGIQSSGYMTVEGDQGFASYVAFGTRDHTALSALPGRQVKR